MFASGVSAFGEEIEAELRRLDPETAAQVQRVIRETLALARVRSGGGLRGEKRAPFRVQTHDLRIRPGIDLDKLGQLADDY